MTKLNKIKGKRVEAGFSQEELANQLSINPMTYHRKETGLREFSINEIYNLSKVLHLTLNDINDIFFANELT